MAILLPANFNWKNVLLFQIDPDRDFFLIIAPDLNDVLFYVILEKLSPKSYRLMVRGEFAHIIESTALQGILNTDSPDVVLKAIHGAALSTLIDSDQRTDLTLTGNR